MKLGQLMGQRADGVTAEPSETRLRSLLTALALLIGPPLLAFVYYKVMFQGLVHPDALDFAQLGRNLNEGRGFVTSILRPLALPPGAGPIDPLRQPDVTHGPLFPLALAMAFGAGSPRDSLVAATSAVFYVLTIPLAYLLGLRAFGRTVGLLAALVMMFSPLMLEYAVSGLPITLAIFLMTGLMAALYTLAARARGETQGLPRAALFGAGLLTGLLYLTDFVFFWIIPVAAAAVLLTSRKRMVASAAWFGVPVLALILPWMIRNQVLTGNFAFGLRGRELWMHTKAYPGHDAYRMVPADLAAGPEVLNGVAMKLFQHLDQVMQTFPQIAATWILAFFLPSLLFRFTDGAANTLRRYLLLALGAILAGSLFFRPEMPLFVTLVPAMLVFSFAFMVHLVQQAQLNRSGVALLATGLAATVLVPLAGSLTWKPKAARSPHAVTASVLGANTRQDEVSLSDQPWIVAWYANRPALWLPKNDGRIKELTARMENARWLFLTEHSRAMNGEWPGVYNLFLQWNVTYAQARAAQRRDPNIKVPPTISISGKGSPLLESLNGFTSIELPADASLTTVVAARPASRKATSRGNEVSARGRG
jgi:hypothetical protein